MRQKWHVLISSSIAYLYHSVALIMPPLLLPSIREDLGLSAALGGLLYTATLLGVGLSSFIVGWISDNYGRRTALLITIIGSSLPLGCVIFVQSWPQLMFINFIAGISIGGEWGVIASFLNETWPEHQRGKAITVVMGCGQLAGIFSSILVWFLAARLGWRSLYLAFFVCLLDALYIFLAVKESPVWLEKRNAGTHKQRSSWTELFHREYRKRTILCTLAAGTTFLALMGWNNWMPSFLMQEKGLDPNQFSLFLIYGFLVTFLACLFFGGLSDRFGRKKTLILIYGIGTVALPLFVFSSGTAALYITGFVAFSTMCYPGIYGSYFSELYPTRLRSTGSGFCFNIGRGMGAIAPPLMGVLSGYSSIGFTIALLSVFLLITPFLLLPLPETLKTKAGG